MNTGIFSQAVGLLACAGAIVTIVLVALVGLAVGMQRGRRTNLANPIIQPPNAPPFEDGDFGGVPTTGSVQEYEREYRPENVIGSSGFEAQTYRYTGENDRDSQRDE